MKRFAIPDVQGDDFESLFPTIGAADLGEEVFEFVRAALIGLELGLIDSGNNVVSVIESFSCQSYPHRRVTRR